MENLMLVNMYWVKYEQWDNIWGLFMPLSYWALDLIVQQVTIAWKVTFLNLEVSGGMFQTQNQSFNFLGTASYYERCRGLIFFKIKSRVLLYFGELKCWQWNIVRMLYWSGKFSWVFMGNYAKLVLMSSPHPLLSSHIKVFGVAP